MIFTPATAGNSLDLLKPPTSAHCVINEKLLRPWQIAPANHLLQILQTYDSALDASGTGCGKSYVALAIAQALRLPCLVVAPKIAISAWRSVSEHFAEPVSIINYELLRGGRTLFGAWNSDAKVTDRRPALYICIRCSRRYTEGNIDSLCPYHEHGVHCLEYKRKPANLGHFTFSPAVRLIILDEFHRCGGLNSLNSKILIAAKRQKIKHLLLSATPAQSPLQMKAMGYSLDLFTL